MASSSNPILAQIQYAKDLGLVNEQLKDLYQLKEENEHRYFDNIFARFYNDTANRFATIEALLNYNTVDFYNIAEQSILLIGSATNIGAVRVTNASRRLRLVADNRSRDGCVQALDVVKRELAAVRPHLDAIVQIERGTSF